MILKYNEIWKNKICISAWICIITTISLLQEVLCECPFDSHVSYSSICYDLPMYFKCNSCFSSPESTIELSIIDCHRHALLYEIYAISTNPPDAETGDGAVEILCVRNMLVSERIRERCAQMNKGTSSSSHFNKNHNKPWTNILSANNLTNTKDILHILHSINNLLWKCIPNQNPAVPASGCGHHLLTRLFLAMTTKGKNYLTENLPCIQRHESVLKRRDLAEQQQQNVSLQSTSGFKPPTPALTRTTTTGLPLITSTFGVATTQLQPVYSNPTTAGLNRNQTTTTISVVYNSNTNNSLIGPSTRIKPHSNNNESDYDSYPVEVKESNYNKKLGMGLGIGLGVFLFLLIILAVILFAIIFNQRRKAAKKKAALEAARNAGRTNANTSTSPGRSTVVMRNRESAASQGSNTDIVRSNIPTIFALDDARPTFHTTRLDSIPDSPRESRAGDYAHHTHSTTVASMEYGSSNSIPRPSLRDQAEQPYNGSACGNNSQTSSQHHGSSGQVHQAYGSQVSMQNSVKDSFYFGTPGSEAQPSTEGSVGGESMYNSEGIEMKPLYSHAKPKYERVESDEPTMRHNDQNRALYLSEVSHQSFYE